MSKKLTPFQFPFEVRQGAAPSDDGSILISGYVLYGIPNKQRPHPYMPDKEGTRLAWQAQADEQASYTGGKSFGNIRIRHPKTREDIGVGRIESWEWHENVVVQGVQTWGIYVTARVFPVELGPNYTIVDSIRQHITTCFSIGANVVKGWWDEVHQAIAYVPDFFETGLVDKPGQYGTTFSIVQGMAVMESEEGVEMPEDDITIIVAPVVVPDDEENEETPNDATQDQALIAASEAKDKAEDQQLISEMIDARLNPITDSISRLTEAVTMLTQSMGNTQTPPTPVAAPTPPASDVTTVTNASGDSNEVPIPTPEGTFAPPAEQQDGEGADKGGAGDTPNVILPTDIEQAARAALLPEIEGLQTQLTASQEELSKQRLAFEERMKEMALQVTQAAEMAQKAMADATKFGETFAPMVSLSGQEPPIPATETPDALVQRIAQNSFADNDKAQLDLASLLLQGVPINVPRKV